MKAIFLALFTLGFVASGLAETRTWTSADGRTIEAQFIQADETKVTIRKNGRNFVLPLDKISEEDRKYIADKQAAEKEFKMDDLGEKKEWFQEEWVKADHDGLPFQVFAPKRLSKGEPLPLVIFLHGVGERGDDGDQQLNGLPKSFVSEDNWRKRKCIVLAPQCPANEYWNGSPGNSVIDLVESCIKELPVDPSRVYIGGYSMGGYGTWSILGKEPKLFACGFPIAGGGSPSIARDIKKIPIWNFHGDADPTVKVGESRKIVEALEKVKGNIKYTEMAGEGHGIAGKVMKDEELHEWIFAQKKE